MLAWVQSSSTSVGELRLVHQCIRSFPSLPSSQVSQFTLHAGVKKAKPDFHRAMATEPARALFDTLVAEAQRVHGSDKVATGRFGAMMQVGRIMEAVG